MASSRKASLMPLAGRTRCGRWKRSACVRSVWRNKAAGVESKGGLVLPAGFEKLGKISL